MLALDALGVDLERDLDTVPRTLGHLGCRNAGVQP
jgi:hypothetical protein